MDTDVVNVWLSRKLRGQVIWNTLAGLCFLVAGLVILYLSFWVTYGVIWFLAHSFHPLSHHVILLMAAAFMVLVILAGAKQNWEDIEPLGRQVQLAKGMDITLTPWTRYGMSYDTNAVKAGAFEVRSIASIVNYVLCGGVKLVLSSLGKWRQTRRLKSIDVTGCARVIALLQAVAKRQSYAQIVESLPGLNPVQVFEDLRYIDGVLFLSTEPSGLTLQRELREELGSYG